MKLINFAHPLTTRQVAEVERIVGRLLDSVLDVPTTFDPTEPFPMQAVRLVSGVPISSTQWQTEAFLVNLPSLSAISALVLAELHGRIGYFPSILRMRPVPDPTIREFEVAEVINLQEVRDRARTTR